MKKYARRPWSQKEVRQLRKLYPDTPTAEIAKALDRTLSQVYQTANRYGLAKSEAYLASPAAGRTSGRQGIGSRFPKGHKPWNDGMKGWAAPGTERTRFKKGRKPQNWVPIGSERITKDGYIQRKISEATGTPRDWRGVHILNWEKRNGPLPKGHAVVFKDGDKRNTAYKNLELVTRAELMRRNTVHRYPEDVKKLIRTVAALNRRINAREKQN